MVGPQLLTQGTWRAMATPMYVCPPVRFHTPHRRDNLLPGASLPWPVPTAPSSFPPAWPAEGSRLLRKGTRPSRDHSKQPVSWVSIALCTEQSGLGHNRTPWL